MKNTIVFIHGMFQNDRSWKNWSDYFEQKGYECIVKSWPLHEGDPADLRAMVPMSLGELKLQTVIDKYVTLIQSEGIQPIVIGHSVGGLIAQILVNMGLAKAGVCISSVAPNKLLSLDWGMFKNAVAIANPLKGDEPVMMDEEGFHANFCNTMTEAESNEAYEKYATHDSRNVFRDCMGEAGKIDLEMTHAPLLFIAAEKDQICPPELNQKNCNAYEDGNSVADYIEFKNRGHFICGQQGWEEIADYTHNWLKSNLKQESDVTETSYERDFNLTDREPMRMNESEEQERLKKSSEKDRSGEMREDLF